MSRRVNPASFNRAVQAGADAFVAGKPYTANPHGTKGALAQAWAMGWNAAAGANREQQKV